MPQDGKDKGPWFHNLFVWGTVGCEELSLLSEFESQIDSDYDPWSVSTIPHHSFNYAKSNKIQMLLICSDLVDVELIYM